MLKTVENGCGIWVDPPCFFQNSHIFPFFGGATSLKVLWHLILALCLLRRNALLFTHIKQYKQYGWITWQGNKHAFLKHKHEGGHEIFHYWFKLQPNHRMAPIGNVGKDVNIRRHWDLNNSLFHCVHSQFPSLSWAHNILLQQVDQAHL